MWWCFKRGKGYHRENEVPTAGNRLFVLFGFLFGALQRDMAKLILGLIQPAFEGSGC